MRALVVISVALVLLVGVATPAAAATLFSAPLSPIDGVDTRHNCWVANVSGATRTVTIQIINVNGVLLVDETSTLAPGEGAHSLNDQFTVEAYCKVSVGGNASGIRATFIFEQLIGGVFRATATTPLQ